MKKIFAFIVGAYLSMGAMAQSALTFDANAGMKSSMTAYDGTSVSFTAYERLFYVTNVEDSTYQFLNVYVPEGATHQTPIFLRTYVGGYMASPAAQPQAGDATGRALKEGYVVVIPGTRGRNSSIVADKAFAKKHKGVKTWKRNCLSPPSDMPVAYWYFTYMVTCFRSLTATISALSRLNVSRNGLKT